MGRRSYAGGVSQLWIEEDEISHVDVTCSGDSADKYPDCALCQGSDGSLAVIVHGGVPPYQFSIDGVNWQSEEYFDNLPVPANKIKSTDEYGGIWIGEYIIYCRDSKGKYANVRAIIQSPVKREWIINPNNCPNYENGLLFFAADAGQEYATPLPNIDYYCPSPSTQCPTTNMSHTVYKEHYNVGQTTIRGTISSRICKESDVYEILVTVAQRRLTNAVQDYDGNWYDAVIVGNQVWLGSNLRTTHYADGTAITSGNQNPSETQERYYLINGEYYYNYFALMNGEESSNLNPSGVQGIAMDGWHVPSPAEIGQFQEYLNSKPEYKYNNESYSIAKSVASNSGWNSSSVEGSPGYNQDQNNLVLMDLKPKGFILNVNNLYLYKYGESCCFNSSYSTNVIVSGNAISYDHKEFTGTSFDKGTPCSVRLVCDMNALDFIKWYWNTYGSFDHQLS